MSGIWQSNFNSQNAVKLHGILLTMFKYVFVWTGNVYSKHSIATETIGTSCLSLPAKPWLLTAWHRFELGHLQRQSQWFQCTDNEFITVRYRYNAVMGAFLFGTDLYCASTNAVLYAISWWIGPRYNGTRLYILTSQKSCYAEESSPKIVIKKA